MTLIDKFIDEAKKDIKRIVLPEADEPRMLEAARRIKDEGIAEPVLVGEQAAFDEARSALGLELDDVEFVDVGTTGLMDGYVQKYVESRGSKESIAKRLLGRPLYFGGMMVAQGEADGLVGGCLNLTATVIKAAGLTIGYADGISAPSSCFIMVVPDCQYGENGTFIYADAAVNPDPTARELAEIAVMSAKSAEVLLKIEPRVAMLSLSTLGSARNASTDKVTEAVALAREMAPEVAIEGEYQADAAIVPAVAAKKVKTESKVAGKANVLIFPDLDAGNICYKLTQYLAKAEAYGPLFQGFARPINDLSRGASVSDIVGVVAITAVQAASA